MIEEAGGGEEEERGDWLATEIAEAMIPVVTAAALSAELTGAGGTNSNGGDRQFSLTAAPSRRRPLDARLGGPRC